MHVLLNATHCCITHIFSTVTVYMKHSRTLTFENFYKV